MRSLGLGFSVAGREGGEVGSLLGGGDLEDVGGFRGGGGIIMNGGVIIRVLAGLTDGGVGGVFFISICVRIRCLGWACGFCGVASLERSQ